MQNLYRNISKIYKRIYVNMKGSSNPPQLGRWNLSYGEDALRKCDLTTEDHCGVCDNMRNIFLDKQKEADKMLRIKN